MNYDFNSLYPSHINFATDPYNWANWQKKFAWIPTKLDNGEQVWLKTFYWRFGVHRFAIISGGPITKTERGTVLDVIARA